ncbi:MAG: glucosamine-6-phosphate deaminase [Bacillaceae bacterium]|nr:glucosamine-6-phosphate deaminase [Bacillaceae bacterium]
MNVVSVDNYQELSEAAAQLIIQKIKKKRNLTIGLATGGTPEGMYKRLIKDYKNNGVSYKDVVSFNLDEYIGLAHNHPNSYRYFMNQTFFNHIDIRDENIHIPNGMASDLQKECREYEQKLQQHGGLDLQILGIGQNGHIGFNEPGTPFETETHIVTLTDTTRKANARYFKRLEEVPTKAITMGIRSILRSKEILLLVYGERKAEAMRRLLTEDPTPHFPASALNLHSNVTIIADKVTLREAMVK